ncbi:MAG: nitroreductase family protein [Christensenellaceae bacterium]|jgi:predicted oxidoreductase (fatty acid repression mutant protein)
MEMDFYEALVKRRSVYGIDHKLTVTDLRLKEILVYILKHCPSANNDQSQRMVLLLGEHNKKLWDIVMEAIGSHAKGTTGEKIRKLSSGYGTVLFFDDTAVTEEYAQKNATYTSLFPEWALQQNGMLQYAVWCALSMEGLGASLQHYNPIIDDEVKKTWNIDESWKLLAQMPFGVPTEQAWDRTYLPVETRFHVFE